MSDWFTLRDGSWRVFPTSKKHGNTWERFLRNGHILVWRKLVGDLKETTHIVTQMKIQAESHGNETSEKILTNRAFPDRTSKIFADGIWWRTWGQTCKPSFICVSRLSSLQQRKHQQERGDFQAIFAVTWESRTKTILIANQWKVIFQPPKLGYEKMGATTPMEEFTKYGKNGFVSRVTTVRRPLLSLR